MGCKDRFSAQFRSVRFPCDQTIMKQGNPKRKAEQKAASQSDFTHSKLRFRQKSDGELIENGIKLQLSY